MEKERERREKEERERERERDWVSAGGGKKRSREGLEGSLLSGSRKKKKAGPLPRTRKFDPSGFS